MQIKKLYQQQAETFQLLSHPVRLQILDELRRREACVCHLQAVTGKPQAYVSQQLRLLKDAGLVSDEKVGQNVFNQLNSEKTLHLLDRSLGTAGSPSDPADCTCPFCSQISS